MNALTLFSLPTAKGTGLTVESIISGEGIESEENGGNAPFAALFDMLLVAQPVAVPVAAGDEDAAMSVAATGKNLPVLPVAETALPDTAVPLDPVTADPAQPVPDLPFADLPFADALPEDPAPAKLASQTGPAPRMPEPATVAAPVIKTLPPPAAPIVTAVQTVPDGSDTTPAPIGTREPSPGTELTEAGEAPATSPAKILAARSGGEMQVQLTISQPVEARSALASTVTIERTDPFQGAQRLDELVQAIAHARETGSNQPVRATISHAEFGVLALRLSREDGGVTAQIVSSDAGFAPAAHHALRTAAETGLSGQNRGEDQPRHQGTASEQQAQSNSQSNAHSQGQSPGHSQAQHNRAAARSDARTDTASSTSEGEAAEPTEQRANGLYA
jgi:hypothetical protein